MRVPCLPSCTGGPGCRTICSVCISKRWRRLVVGDGDQLVAVTLSVDGLVCFVHGFDVFWYGIFDDFRHLVTEIKVKLNDMCFKTGPVISINTIEEVLRIFNFTSSFLETTESFI